MPTKRPDHIKQASINRACELIDQGWDRAIICTLLCAEFGYCRKTALREHNEAEALLAHEEPPSADPMNHQHAMITAIVTQFAMTKDPAVMVKLAGAYEKLARMGGLKYGKPD